MKVLTIILAAVAAGVGPAALADPYKDLAAQGYRWVSVDGPYACRSKDDLREISKQRTRTDVELKMGVQELRAYYLIQGQIVQIDQVDVAAGGVADPRSRAFHEGLDANAVPEPRADPRRFWNLRNAHDVEYGSERAIGHHRSIAGRDRNLQSEPEGPC